MAELYNHREVESKWQKVWDDEKAFKTSDDFTKPKYYALVGYTEHDDQRRKQRFVLSSGYLQEYTECDQYQCTQ